MRAIWFWAAVCAALVLTAGCATQAAESAADMNYTTIAQGLNSWVKQRHLVVIRDAQTFDHWWRVAHSRQLPQTQLPEVDFSQDMVIALFMGERRTGGYRIGISGLSENDGALVVHVTEQSPGAGCLTPQMVTYPYAFAKMARAEQVRFETTQVKHPC